MDLEENLHLIYDTVRYLKEQGKEVIFDAEHFFDGYKNNPSYALRAIQAAERAGADWLALCDTNGACFPHEIESIVRAVRAQTTAPIGIHTHNDTGMANANVIAAVREGATMVQLTLNGIGERCGNANLWTCIPNLQLKDVYKRQGFPNVEVQLDNPLQTGEQAALFCYTFMQKHLHLFSQTLLQSTWDWQPESRVLTAYLEDELSAQAYSSTRQMQQLRDRCV